jgi:glycosyltransferase involved in cell wall biosynthesis
VHGETGFLVPHGDVPAMSAVMRRIADSPELVATLGMQARRFAETFTWERTASETEEHLQSIVAQEVDRGGAGAFS